MNIYIVSPDYLDPIVAESSYYNVSVVVHGSYEAAYRNLIYVNSSELCSLVVVAESLPSGKDKDNLHRLVEAFNMLSEHSSFKKRLVLCLRNTIGVEEIISNWKTNFLEIYGDKFEVITDLYIRREVLGTAISSFSFPYKESSVHFPKFTSGGFKGFGYNPVLSPIAIKSMLPVRLRPTLTETIVRDETLGQLKSESSFYYSLRLCSITNLFQPNSDLDDQIIHLISSVDNADLEFMYQMMYEYSKLHRLEVMS